MIKTIYIREFMYKKEKYRFKKPLHVVFNNFLASDCKTQHGELAIPEVYGGYSQKDPFPEDPKEMEKVAKDYLKTVWDEYLLKEDKDFTELADIKYRHAWINLLRPPK